MCVCACVIGYQARCVCCLVIRFLFTIIIYIYLLLWYAAHTPHSTLSPFSLSLCVCVHPVSAMAFLFFDCLFWLLFFFSLFSTVDLPFLVAIWVVFVVVKLCANVRNAIALHTQLTHAHTHMHTRTHISPTHSSTISVHNTLPSDFFSLSFTYFSLATNLSFVFLYPTAVVVVPVVLYCCCPFEFMRYDANVCSINEIIVGKCVMMKLFWVTS